MFGDSPNDLLNNLNEEHPLVVAVEYISKEESADVAAGSASAKHGVTGILAVSNGATNTAPSYWSRRSSTSASPKLAETDDWKTKFKLD